MMQQGLRLLWRLLTGPAKKPERPGVSVQLHCPVLLANERTLAVKDNMESLTTTSAATGLNFPEYTLLDSSGTIFTVEKVTELGRKSVILDMGTSQFRVFLELRANGKPSLEKAKSLIKKMTFSRGQIQDIEGVSQKIDSAKSFPDLIEVSRKSWEWR
jgi:hypothetical protein